ncbi:hypothetical protein ACFL5Z_01120 [Planctomycetota bacterium]
MKKAIAFLFCSLSISLPGIVLKAQDGHQATAWLKADPNASTFKITWPEAGADRLLAPVGLINRLPPDGTWARFEGNETFVTIASVGKTMVAQQPCRWIEVILEVSDRDLIWKLLIREDCLKRERNILEHALSVWHCRGREKALNITGMSPGDEFGDLTFILAGPDQEVRSLGPQVIETKLRRFECALWTGRQLTTFDQREFDATFRQWVHEKAPFGVLRSDVEYTIKFDGNVTQAKDSITLVEVGTGAHSRISTGNRSIEELTARPFAPMAGWRWAQPPVNCKWMSRASRGLAMSIHRRDEEFWFTFAYPWVSGAAEYRAVAFDRNQRRYKFSELPGAASGTVGLKSFTLLHEILPHDQVKYVGIEKQRQDMSKTPPSLVDKSLPNFANVLFNSVHGRTEENALLICFFDMDQRPSRSCLLQLAKRAEGLKRKDIIVVAIQASEIDEDKLNEWVKKNSISFPVGLIQSDEEKTCFTWGVKSLPWLILTDTYHKVSSSGFSLTELDEKIQSAQ